MEYSQKCNVLKNVGITAKVISLVNEDTWVYPEEDSW